MSGTVYLNTHTSHINLYDLVFQATLFSGITLALLLAFAKKASKSANLFLGLALGAMVLKVSGCTAAFLPALGPLLFFYTRKLISSDQRFQRKDMLHFCTILAGYWMPVWLALLGVVIYLYLSHRLIQHFYDRLRPVLMDRPRFAFRQLERTLLVLGFLCLLWIFNGLFSFALAFVLIGMAAEVMLKPDNNETLHLPIADKWDAKEKGRRLKETVATNRLYEDAELTLVTLAVKLAIHPHDLSRIINLGLDKNFNDFINEFRVREVARKMKDPAYDKLTLLGIAYESGFNSQSTFHRVFKELTGKTPAEYKKELSTYKLGARSQHAAIILNQETTPMWSREKLNRNVMFRNYLKIAWRNLIARKVYSGINVLGLAAGMAIAMLIGLWIWDEVSFDKYHKNYETVGQLMTTQTSNGETETFPSTVVPLSNELRFKYAAEIKRIALTWEGTHILSVGDTKISQTGMFAEPDLPAILSLVMIKGSYKTFNDPSSLLLSASVAKALFGDDEPINKVIRIDNDKTMKVAGVYQDLPHNTSFNQMMFMLPWSSPANWWNTQTAAWSNHGCHLFVQLNSSAGFDKLSAQIRNITKPHFKINDETMQVFPMPKWHLYSEFKNGQSVGGRIQLIWLFGVIGAFVLLLACINFMNLSTARSEKRAKEVGVRKAIGSARSQLVNQFLSESMLVVALALVLTFAIVLLAIPSFNNIADKQVSIPWSNPLFWLYTLSFAFFTGLLSGSYPAFYLSSFKPVKVLKGSFKVGRLASMPRKILVVLQFTVSIVLIIGTIVVFRQIQFASSRPVGYTREGLITIQMNTPQIFGHYDALRNSLIQTGAVQDMAESNSATTQVWSNNAGFTWEGQTPGYNPTFGTIAVTTDFGNTIGWKIIEGRDFSRSHTADTGAFILNESAVKLSGIKNPIGKVMRWLGKDHVITGVVKDMVMESPYKPTIATVFHMQPDWVNLITIRINPKISAQTALSKIESVFKIYNPGSPFSYKFTNDEYAKKFSDEQRIGQLATVFAMLAIFISCLGLFGMASFVAEQRVKEIGVRKVLGASTYRLWQMLSKEFALLVIISCFVAIPLAWYYSHIWLKQYAYKTPLSVWIFIASGVGALAITLITVSFQSVKAALANPVKSLRSE